VAISKISASSGGFTGILEDQAAFGASLAWLGDLDGDGVTDLAVGGGERRMGGSTQSLWILLLNSNGTTKSQTKASSEAAGFPEATDASAQFGDALAAVGDLDGDSVPDVAVGAPFEVTDRTTRGAVWLLFLNSNGSVKSYTKIINDGNSGFSGDVESLDVFGGALACPGDVNGDSVPDLAVGASGDQDGGASAGAVWILFLGTGGAV